MFCSATLRKAHTCGFCQNSTAKKLGGLFKSLHDLCREKLRLRHRTRRLQRPEQSNAFELTTAPPMNFLNKRPIQKSSGKATGGEVYAGKRADENAARGLSNKPLCLTLLGPVRALHLANMPVRPIPSHMEPQR